MFFKKERIKILTHDYKKQGVLISSSYNFCAQCIKLFDYEECGYFVDLNY